MTKTDFYPVLESTRDGTPQTSQNKSERFENEEENSPLSHDLSIESLDMLTTIVSRVENPSFALSLEQAIEICFDVGLLLKNQGSIKVSENEDIFEDPLDRSDSLGNVRMIHKKPKTSNTMQIAALGNKIIEITQEAQRGISQERKFFLNYDENLYHLGEYDDCETEDILKGKMRIQQVRHENYQVDRRNSKLYTSLQDAKRKLEKARAELLFEERKTKYLSTKLDDQISTCCYSPVLSEYAVPVCFKSADEDGNRIIQSRKLKNDDKSDSQLDILSW